MKAFIQKMIQSFFIIATGSLASTAIFITLIDPHATLDVIILWQILAIALLTTPLSFIFYAHREFSKKEALIRQVIHYIILNIVLVGCAYLFDWFSIRTPKNLLLFIGLIFIVYLSANYFCFTGDKKEANKLNEKIKQYQKEKQ